jgi:hypothetical protein
MAGDWIKITHELPSKPEVLAISQRLGVSRFDVVGRLHALWTWFDQHTENGHASSVTSVTLLSAIFGDNISSEFASALLDVGWLEEDEDGVQVPNFDRHISETAKTRALNNARQQRRRATGHDSDAKESRQKRDSTVTREEKRREEETPPYSPPSGNEQTKNGKKRKPTTPPPDDFEVTDKMWEWARGKGIPDQVVRRETEQFLNHHRAKDSRFRDWQMAWRTWLTNWLKWEGDKHKPSGPKLQEL